MKFEFDLTDRYSVAMNKKDTIFSGFLNSLPSLNIFSKSKKKVFMKHYKKQECSKFYENVCQNHPYA